MTVKNASVLDISTMEGMFSVLLSRRGAFVTATDSISLYDKINLLMETYEVEFDYHPHVPVQGVSEYMFSLQTSKSFTASNPLVTKEKSNFGYDVVVSSGLIYHVLNPVDHVISYRKLTKEGGGFA